jgi:modification methylase
MDDKLPLDQVIQGNCIDVLASLPDDSIDLVFADPPYNLQLKQALYRPNMTLVDAVNDEWDHFTDLNSYDEFSRAWLSACRRVLKPNGTLWVIGTYHNIYRIGSILQDLDFWFLNDVVWVKNNPMPNFRGVRFTNAHETLLWAAKTQKSRYTFNHHAAKSLNDEKQMRSDWLLNICTGFERLKENGKKAHSTQKPEALLYRIMLTTSNPGDVVLDPFFGTGTTGAVAKKLHRHFLGIEKEEKYVRLARSRIENLPPELFDEVIYEVRDRKRIEPRVPFGTLLENGLLRPGQQLYFRCDREKAAVIKPDGNLKLNGFEGSIHQLGKQLMGGSPCNGWDTWYYENPDGRLAVIDELRKLVLEGNKLVTPEDSDMAEPGNAPGFPG